jgi:hypothetical protein
VPAEVAQPLIEFVPDRDESCDLAVVVSASSAAFTSRSSNVPRPPSVGAVMPEPSMWMPPNSSTAAAQESKRSAVGRVSSIDIVSA